VSTCARSCDSIGCARVACHLHCPFFYPPENSCFTDKTPSILTLHVLFNTGLILLSENRTPQTQESPEDRHFQRHSEASYRYAISLRIRIRNTKPISIPRCPPKQWPTASDVTQRARLQQRRSSFRSHFFSSSYIRSIHRQLESREAFCRCPGARRVHGE
jgi:hypothetical protein